MELDLVGARAWYEGAGATSAGETASPCAAVDEGRRLDRLAPRNSYWEHRAIEMQAAGEESKAKYALLRANALTRRIRPRLEACGTKAIPLSCKCSQRLTYERCRQWWLCTACQQKRTASVEIKLRKSLDARLADELAAWRKRGQRGSAPSLALVTLTARHTGDLELDRRQLEDGWRKLYKAMHPTWGVFPYVRVWEVTPGRCKECEGYVDDLEQHSYQHKGNLMAPKRAELDEVGRSSSYKQRKPCTCASPQPEGHLHMHIAVVWGYRDYAALRQLWLDACPNSEVFSVVRARSDGNASTPRSCSKYLGKYLSKGVDVAAFTPTLRADVSAAMYNAHSLDASKGFWIDEECVCPKCRAAVKRIDIVDTLTWERLVSIRQGVLDELYWVRRKRTFYELHPRIELGIVAGEYHYALPQEPVITATFLALHGRVESPPWDPARFERDQAEREAALDAAGIRHRKKHRVARGPEPRCEQ